MVDRNSWPRPSRSPSYQAMESSTPVPQRDEARSGVSFAYFASSLALTSSNETTFAGIGEMVPETAINQFSFAGCKFFFRANHDAVPKIAAQFDLFRERKCARLFENRFRTHGLNLPRQFTRAARFFNAEIRHSSFVIRHFPAHDPRESSKKSARSRSAPTGSSAKRSPASTTPSSKARA